MSEWSSLEAEARKRTKEAGPRCAVEVFLRHLDAADRREVEKVLGNPSLTTVGIQRAVSGLIGMSAPSGWSIGNHRRGKCRCGR